MNLISLLLATLLVNTSTNALPQPRHHTQDENKLERILQSISNTTPEEQKIIQRAMRLKPEVNGMKSEESLERLVEDYCMNKGAYNIIPFGWKASQMENGHWKVIFHYQTFMKEYAAAEWEYDENKNKIYPFEKINAPTFWTPFKRKLNLK